MGALSMLRPPLSLADWEALPEDDVFRIEVAEGVPMLWPPWSGLHQRSVRGIAHALGAQLPDTSTVVRGVEVLLEQEPLTVRVPDLAVAPTALVDSDPGRYSSSDVQLVVEVSVDGSRRIDRVMKFSEYAEFGVALYWIVDLGEPVTVSSFVLVGGTYELVEKSTDAADLDVAGHPVHLDLAALTRR